MRPHLCSSSDRKQNTWQKYKKKHFENSFQLTQWGCRPTSILNPIWPLKELCLGLWGDLLRPSAGVALSYGHRFGREGQTGKGSFCDRSHVGTSVYAGPQDLLKGSVGRFKIHPLLRAQPAIKFYIICSNSAHCCWTTLRAVVFLGVNSHLFSDECS